MLYSGYGIGSHSRSEFSLTDGSVGKSDIIFGVDMSSSVNIDNNKIGADMSSSVHIDNNEKDILILGKDLTQGLDDTTLLAEAQYSINFQDQVKFFV